MCSSDLSTLEQVVVVRSSLAGLRACESLRQQGFTGTIQLVGSEAHLPYDRQPLSKRLLSGEWSIGQTLLRKPESLAELELTLRQGVAASGLDTQSRRVQLADGSTVSYDGLIIATGSVCRRLPNQPTLRGLHELRTLDDSIALRDAFAAGGRGGRSLRLVVIGAGFIGLEAAATARST